MLCLQVLIVLGDGQTRHNRGKAFFGFRQILLQTSKFCLLFLRLLYWANGCPSNPVFLPLCFSGNAQHSIVAVNAMRLLNIKDLTISTLSQVITDRAFLDVHDMNNLHTRVAPGHQEDGQLGHSCAKDALKGLIGDSAFLPGVVEHVTPLTNGFGDALLVLTLCQLLTGQLDTGRGLLCCCDIQDFINTLHGVLR